MIRGRIAAGLLACASIFLTGCGENSSQQVVAATPLSAAPKTAEPAAEAFFVASGPLVVEHQVDVEGQRDGLISKILIEPGTRVKKGQTLALMDDRQLTSDLEAARAKTRSMEADLKNWQAETKVLQSDFERAQKLWDAKIISKEQLDHDRYKLESDQYDVQRSQELLANSRHVERSLDLELEKTRVVAPFDGIVARRYVRAGQEINHGERLFWVTAEAPLLVRFTLPEHFMGHVKRGTQFSLTSLNLPEEKHTVRVTEVSPVVDPSSATIEVLAELVGARGELRPGMSTNVLVPNPQ